MSIRTLIRSTDFTISASLSRSTIRAIAYGIVVILALIYVLVTLFGL